MRTLLLGIATTFVVSGAPALAAAPPPDPKPTKPLVDDAELKLIAGFLDTLEGQVEKTLADPPDDTPFMQRAANPKLAARYLAAFRKKARALGVDSDVEIIGFEARITLWFGIVPLRELEAYIWWDGETPRLLRLTRIVDKHSSALFRQRVVPPWSSEEAKAFDALMSELAGRLSRGECDQLPIVGAKHVARAMPIKDEEGRKKALEQVLPHIDRLPKTCKSLAGVPFNRLSWRLSDVGVVGKDKGGERVSFRVTLRPMGEERARIARISPPSAPNETKAPRPEDKKKGAPPAKDAAPDKPDKPTGG